MAFTTPSELLAWYKRQEQQGSYDDDLNGMFRCGASDSLTCVVRRFMPDIHCGRLWIICVENRRGALSLNSG
ncbi:hypothetical protein C5470_19255 [Photorhabdus stackebrandtii]|uniref:Uncharacterized protein n=1 Tax=Photorhabdus stackebrandtii TaxID=1123042 RepID=A0A7X5TLT3_9GAMM|nr:hypothetical protein [Photorhabdus stackebrandtii]